MPKARGVTELTARLAQLIWPHHDDRNRTSAPTPCRACGRAGFVRLIPDLPRALEPWLSLKIHAFQGRSGD